MNIFNNKINIETYEKINKLELDLKELEDNQLKILNILKSQNEDIKILERIIQKINIDKNIDNLKKNILKDKAGRKKKILDKDKKLEIKEFYNICKNKSKTAKNFGLSRDTIRKIVNNNY